MRIIEKIDGKEVVESISFSDRDTISTNLYSNLTQKIYDSLMDYQKDMIDKYLSQKYPNGFDEIGFEEFVKFELEDVLKEKDEYLIYPGFLSFYDITALDNLSDEIREAMDNIFEILEDLEENDYDTTHWSFIKLSELSYALENEVLPKIELLKEANEQDFDEKKNELNVLIKDIMEHQINSEEMNSFLKDTHYNLLENTVDEVLHRNQEIGNKSIDFLKKLTLKELQEFSPKGKEQNENIKPKGTDTTPKDASTKPKETNNHNII